MDKSGMGEVAAVPRTRNHSDIGAASATEADDAASVLEKLRTRLLDLTLTNRLLNFKQSSARVVRVIDELPDQLFNRLRQGADLELLPVPEPPEDHPLRARAVGSERASRTATAAAYAAELGLATSYDLPAPTPSTTATARVPKHADDAIQTLLFPSELERVLRNVASDARGALEEKGSNILYLAFGFLEWFEAPSSDKVISSPLVMVPVSLRRGEPDRKTGAYRFYVSYSNDDVLPNIPLQEKLRRDFRLNLPDLEEEDTPETYLARIAKTVPLLPRWNVRRHVSLGLLSFTKLFMYRDLDPAGWPEGEGPLHHPRVAELLGGGASDSGGEVGGGYDGEYDFEGGDAGPAPPLVPPIVVDADSSQHSAIVDAIAGKSFVIEGPPGTGKSQTIANLIAAAMDAGKTVLFVAEKLTALDVVRKRLGDVGLGPFCLELHSDKTQKSMLMDDLRLRIERRRTFRAPTTLDERARVLAESKHRLNAYARKINAKVGPINWTVHDVLWGTGRRRADLGAQAEIWKNVAFPSVESLTLSEYEELRRCAVTFGETLAQVRRQGALANHPFWGIWPREPNLAFEADLLERLKDLAAKASDAITRSRQLSGELDAPCPSSIEILDTLDAWIEVLHRTSQEAVIEGANALATPGARQELSDWTQDLAAYIENRSRLDSSLRDPEARRIVLELPPGALDGFAADAPLSRVADVPQLVQSAKTEIGEAASFLARFEAAVGSPLPRIAGVAQMARDVVDCASRAPLDALSYRTRGGDDVDALLESAHERCASLTRRAAELDAAFHLARVPEPEVLESHAAVCATAGIFAFLSGAYRAAKRQFLVLQRQPAKASKDSMAMAFGDLAAHMRERHSFESDATLRELLGSAFRGLGTRFDKVFAARAWQKEALALQRKHRRVMGALPLSGAPREMLEDLAALHKATPPLGRDVLASTRAVLGLRAAMTDVDAAALSDLDETVEATARLVEPMRATLLRLQARGPMLSGDLRKFADEHRTLEATRTRLEHTTSCRAALGESFAGVATSIATARATHAYADLLFDAKTPDLLRGYLLKKPHAGFRDRLVSLTTSAKRSLIAMYATEDAFRSGAAVTASQWYGGDELRLTPELVLARCNRALTAQAALPAWLSYLRARIALFAVGGDFIRDSAERDARVDLATLGTAAEFVVHATHAARAFARDPELARHDGSSHSSVRDQFRRYDEDVMRLERERMAARIDARTVPEGVRSPLAKNRTEMALLEHELGKQRAHVPIRQLVNRAGGALRALKPCFMMSPRSVAQYLAAGAHSFDLVVMDEASQLRPEDAMGAVVRGRQLIVVGDSKQLPPTNFFTTGGDDDATPEEDENEAITDNKESILDLARTACRSVRRLRWHYRSRHASLIAFSNERYYANDLIVFPSTQAVSDDIGVRLVHVDQAIYADGENLVEAQTVVDAVVEHLRLCAEETIGIVALNVRQKTLIQETLYERFKSEPELRQRFERAGQSDGGFVKNLESVQGDERDVIFISVTYGPGADGRVARRFGPLNAANGWRRLNVLFTRAKRRVVLFSSFAPEQLGDEGLSRGAKDLRDYIAFARAGGYQAGEMTAREPDSDFEVAVATALRSAGYRVTPQVGVAGYFIDLAVKRADRSGPYLLGVECDGAPYHSSFSARDRDRLRQQVLEGLGWKIHRIWSTDWYRDADQQTARVLEAIRRAEATGR